MKHFIMPFLIFLLFSGGIKSQNAPSLQIGLGELQFAKGTLDYELVAELIAKKQDDLQIRLIKNMLLDKVGFESGVFYNFINNNIDIITKEKNEDTRNKNLLENVVNLSFICAFTDYYISTLQPNTTEWENFKNLSLSHGFNISIFENSSLTLTDFVINSESSEKKLDNNRIKIEDQKDVSYRFISLIIDMVGETVRENDILRKMGLFRTNFFSTNQDLNSFYELNGNEYYSVYKDFQDPFTKLFNQYKKVITLFENENADINEIRKYINKIDSFLKSYDSIILMSDTNALSQKIKAYNAIKKNSNKTTEKIDKNIKLTSDSEGKTDTLMEQYMGYLNKFHENNYQSARFLKPYYSKKVFDDISEFLIVYVKWIDLIKLMQTLKLNTANVNEYLYSLNEIFGCENQKIFYSSISEKYKTVMLELRGKGVVGEKDTVLARSIDIVSKFISDLKNAPLKNVEVFTTWESQIKPAFIILTKYSPEFIDLKDSIENNLMCLCSKIDEDFKNMRIFTDHPFTTLLTSIYEFDKTETYVQFLNYLNDVSDFIPIDETKKAMAQVINFLRNYIVVIQDADAPNAKKLSIDVEGFILGLESLPYNKGKYFAINFTVGENLTFFNKNVTIYGQDTISKLRNFSFVGEKIGVKYKIIDWSYKNSFSRGDIYNYYSKTFKRLVPPNEPLISDIHFLAYGTGLLYNLVNLSNEKNYNSPMVGIGFGTTFYNSLDLNVSFGKPILKNEKFLSNKTPYFLNVGLDIPFGEYLTALNDKRKRNSEFNKIQKAKEATKNEDNPNSVIKMQFEQVK